MRSWLGILVFAGLVSASGCSDPLDPEPGDLLGRWESAPAQLAPQGWHQYHLSFTRTGGVIHEVRTYGLYPGQESDALSAFSRVEGRFRRDGGRLFFEPERLVWWDSFYGTRSPAHVEEPYPWGGLFDDATYVVRGNELTLHFTVYPADAPEPATARYRRVP